MRTSRFALGLALLFVPGLALAQNDDGDRIERLEQRLQELEGRVPPAEAAEVADESVLERWTDRIRLGGSASAGYFDGESRSLWNPGRFEVWDARLFVDAELGEDVRLADTTIVRNLGFSFEWNLVRLGSLQDDRNQNFGDVYVEFQGLGDSRFANARVGRFQLPIGENYLRFDKGARDNPFITNTIGGPWWWDEGIRLDGSDARSRFGYVASVTSGDTRFNDDSNSDLQGTLKLWTRPTSWLLLSASGAITGEVGSKSSPALGAIWLGETWATAFGSMSSVDNYVHGVVTPDGPNKLDRTWLVGADAVIDVSGARLWLAYGRFDIENQSMRGLYDRDLHYWIAELVLDGDLAHPVLEPFWLGLRANGLGTYDDEKGYLLDIRYGNKLGYNMKSYQAYEIVLGWRLTRFASIRAQYSFVDVDVVDGVSSDIRRKAGRQDKFGADVSVWF